MEKGKIIGADVSKCIEWQIYDFDLELKKGNSLTSPKFSFLDSTWSLQFLPNVKLKDKSWASMRLAGELPENSYHFIRAHIGIKITMDSEYISHTLKETFSSYAPIHAIDRFVLMTDLKRDIRRIVHWRVVTFYCSLICTDGTSRGVELQLQGTDVGTDRLEEDFKTIREKVSVKPQTAFPSPGIDVSTDKLEEDFKTIIKKVTVETQTTFPSPGDHKLAQNLRDLLSTGKETDVILRVQGQDFKSHRAILAGRSTVFAAMLKHDLKEKDSGLMLIEDCDPGAFENFLEHLYTGSTQMSSEDNAVSLCQIADKYNCPDLKENCMDFLLHTLSVEAFCEVTKLSMQYNEGELLKEVVGFFVKNVRKICVSDPWKTFLQEHPLQANYLNIKALEYHGICE